MSGVIERVDLFEFFVVSMSGVIDLVDLCEFFCFYVWCD